MGQRAFQRALLFLFLTFVMANSFPPIAHAIGTTGVHNWTVAFCTPSDISAVRPPSTEFQTLFDDPDTGARRFWSTVSYGTYTIGSLTMTTKWEQMRQNRNFYFANNAPNINAMAQDCIGAMASDSSLPFSIGSIENVVFVFSYWPDGLAPWGGTAVVTMGGQSRVIGAVWLHPADATDGVLSHEMGHTLGWEHSYVKHPGYADNPWDLMGGGWQIHPVAYQKFKAGWLDNVPELTTTSGAITLDALEQPQGTTRMATVHTPQGPLYTIEMRRTSADVFSAVPMPLDTSAMVIHRVDQRAAADRQIQLIDTGSEPGYWDKSYWTNGEQYAIPETGQALCFTATTVRLSVSGSCIIGPQLAVTALLSSPGPRAGDTVELTLTVTNSGDAAATNGTMTLVLPATITTDTATTWTLGAMNAGIAQTHTITLQTDPQIREPRALTGEVHVQSDSGTISVNWYIIVNARQAWLPAIAH